MTDRGEDHEEGEHAGPTEHERLAATKVLHDVQAAESGAKVDSAENDLGDETVVETSTLENGGSL